MLLHRLKRRIWYLIQDHRRNRVIARLAQLCKNLHRAYEHPGFEFEVNGERNLMLTVAEFVQPTVVFDVGANKGDWTETAIAIFPNACFHLFEIAPPTFEELQGRMKGRREIILNNFGLSSATGDISLIFCPEHSELSSGELVPHSISTIALAAHVETGDAYVESHGIQHIDFLKIDTEGMEFKVLQGFRRTLETMPPAVIQFEHFLGRNFLKDFYDLLEPLGYEIGKLYSTYVEFRPHDISLEDGIGPNYIAVHQSQKGLAKLLKEGFLPRSEPRATNG